MTTKSRDKDTGLLEKRNKSLRESRQRTERLYKKASKLGLMSTYRDHKGKLRRKKESR